MTDGVSWALPAPALLRQPGAWGNAQTELFHPVSPQCLALVPGCYLLDK